VQYCYGGQSKPLPTSMVSQDVVIRIDIGEVQGDVGLSLVHPSGAPLVTHEQALKATDVNGPVFFRISPANLPASVLFRNYGDASGKPGSITVSGVSYAPVKRLSKAQMDAIVQAGLNTPRGR
jgi:hypothetical protein